MKKLLIYPALVLVLGACNNNEAEKQAEIERARESAIDSVNDVHIRARLDDSMRSLSDATILPAPLPPESSGTGHKPVTKKGGTKKDKPETSEPKKETPNTAGTPTSAPTPAPAPESTVNSGSGDGTETAGNDKAPTPEEKKKKGINNTVKGAIIGAGAGAVGGAIINKKNPGKGAIIGGVIGAGAGAVTGIILDKNKKKKEAAKDSAGAKTSTKEPESPKP